MISMYDNRMDPPSPIQIQFNFLRRFTPDSEAGGLLLSVNCNYASPVQFTPLYSQMPLYHFIYYRVGLY